MTKTKFNGLARWILLGIMVLTMVVTFFVRAALVEERLEGIKETHRRDIEYVREDLKTIKTDVKKILEKL